MKIFRHRALGAVFCLFLVGNSFGESNPYQIDEALDQTIRTGLRELYNLNFDGAREIFNSIQEKAEDHPLAAFGLATVEWWKISVNVTENDPMESRPFLVAANRCMKLSQAKIKSGDPTGEAHLTLGSIYALLARWEAANHRWIAVYRREKKASANLKKALQANPAAADAYMALGIFDYTLSTLPKLARIFSGSRASADASQGLRELELAVDKGIYLRLPALFLLASIYSEDLKDPAKTVEMLSRLRLEYPESPFVDTMMFTALYNEGCPIEMSFEAADYEARVENGIYRPEFMSQAAFSRALVHFKLHEWPEAKQSFDLAIQAASENSPFKIWARLYKGYTLDALGKREDAIENYRRILQERPRWKSHDFAKQRMKHPFVNTDPEMTTLLL